MINRLIALCLFGVGLSVGPAAAHRIDVPVSSIEWNERSEKWEISHRLSVHDLEEVLGGEIDLSVLTQDELGQLISEYVEANFFVLGFMFLKFIGAEIDGDYVWAYYELWGWDQTVTISNKLMLEAGVTSAALVNLKSGDELQTIIFEGGTNLESVPLHRPMADR